MYEYLFSVIVVVTGVGLLLVAQELIIFPIWRGRRTFSV
jgi:hypothetical protein